MASWIIDISELQELEVEETINLTYWQRLKVSQTVEHLSRVLSIVIRKKEIKIQMELLSNSISFFLFYFFSNILDIYLKMGWIFIWRPFSPFKDYRWNRFKWLPNFWTSNISEMNSISRSNYNPITDSGDAPRTIVAGNLNITTQKMIIFSSSKSLDVNRIDICQTGGGHFWHMPKTETFIHCFLTHISREQHGRDVRMF